MGKSDVKHLPVNVRVLADKSSGERLRRWDPQAEALRLLNPFTGRFEPWPVLAFEPEGDPPVHAVIPTAALERWLAHGAPLVSVEGERVVTRPGGPESDPYRPEKLHVFRHVDRIVFHFTTLGDVAYAVTQQPDKWHDGPEGTDRAGDPQAVVRHYYLATREG